MRFSVVVPVLNSRPFLNRCLDSILRAMQRCEGSELVAIDNGSTDGSLELLRRDYSKVARIEQATGVTVGALRNRGAALTKGDVLVFIDSDCTIAEDYFDRAREVLERTGADATGSKVILPAEPTWVEKTWYMMHLTEREGPTHYINSGNLVVRRAAFDSLHGFSESLVTGEDSEFGLRLKNSNYLVYAAPSVSAVHLANDKTIGVFVRKHIWRGLGMFISGPRSFGSKPVLMTLTHLALIILAGVEFVFASWPLALRTAVLLLLINIVPAAAVVYRTVLVRRRVSLLHAIFLYQLFFFARICSLGLIAMRLPKSGSPAAKSFSTDAPHKEAGAPIL